MLFVTRVNVTGLVIQIVGRPALLQTSPCLASVSSPDLGRHTHLPSRLAAEQ